MTIHDAPSHEAPAHGMSSNAPDERGVVGRRHDEVLAAIARFAGSSLELDDVLERIVEQAARLTGADRASIWLLDRPGRRLLPSALFGMDPDFTASWKKRPLPVSAETLSREAIETGQPVVVLDALSDPRTDKASVEFFGDRSILVAPLTRRGRTLGTLFLNHVGHYYAFSQDDVETTVAIANQAAVAIDNARLFGDARRRATLLSRSFRLAADALTAGIESEQTLREMIQLAVETVDADGGSISLLDDSGRGTYVVATAGTATPDTDNTSRELPLHVEGRQVGLLRLWRQSPPLDEDQDELMASFAGHMRAVLEHHHLYAGLQAERQRVIQAERTKSDFVSMVSHELRTPLALIKGYVATLLRPSLGLSPEMQSRFLEGIDGAADRLRRLIDNLLSVAAVEASVFLHQPQPLEVEPLVRTAVAEASMIARGRAIQVAIEDEGLRLLGDLDQLTQVLENLIGNALKHTPGESPVSVRARRDNDHLRITVADSGPGIPPGALELIFEKFYRVSGPATPATAATHANGGPAVPGASGHAGSATGHRPSGLGLGLYICRRIVEAHGGRIWAENLETGGAAFHIELPAG